MTPKVDWWRGTFRVVMDAEFVPITTLVVASSTFALIHAFLFAAVFVIVSGKPDAFLVLNPIARVGAVVKLLV